MSTHLTRRLIAGTAGLAAAATLAMASPATALTTTYQRTTTTSTTTSRPRIQTAVWNPGPGYDDPGDSESCRERVGVANTLLNSAWAKYDKGDIVGAKEDAAAADAIAGQANSLGCNLIQMT